MTHKAEVRTTLLPWQKGTVRLYKEYGDQLVCVRYRYDTSRFGLPLLGHKTIPYYMPYKNMAFLPSCDRMLP